MNAPQKIEAVPTLPYAMARAFADIEAAMKDSKNPHFKSKYADITAVIGAIKPALVKHGLFFTQHPEPSEKGVTVETFLHHEGGDKLSLGKLFVPANKQDAQGYGSALTYARRYALVTAFGVPTEDDDGNAAVKAGKEAQPETMPDDVHAGLVTLVEKTSSNVPKLMEAAGLPKDTTLRDLDQAGYTKVKGLLEDKLARMVKAESDAKAKEPA
tara:strand:- start:44 stop:682 length:639 start_codon:yes stop_codon:yes gene_type:complete